MRGTPRELTAAACLALSLSLAACAPSSRTAEPTPSASPSASPSSASASPSPTPSPAGTPEARATVIGVIGDWGVNDPALADVVRVMSGFNGGDPLDAVVTTGDNAYVTGTSAQAAYARRQLAPLLRGGTRLYASLGNHDEYTLNGRPVMRAFGMRARWYTAVVGPVQLVVLDANRTDDPAQLAFVKRTLAAPRPVPYRVLVFHQVVGSCSYHGPEPGVVKNWLPLFGGRVDLVLNGHNHTYERFTGPAGTPYVVTGGGGARLYPSARIACRGPVKVSFLDTVYHAVRLTATPQRLVVEAIGLDGSAFDTVTVYPKVRK